MLQHVAPVDVVKQTSRRVLSIAPPIMDTNTHSYPLPQLWAGVEATINRVHDRYTEQLSRSGHLDRISDLDLFADLGVKSLRFPVLWEQIAPATLEHCEWTWPDRSLTRLRELGIDPILGLLHHGSGPAYTNLLDPHFPELLAEYATRVAERYPWATVYTPVNEPLTTARFSALYGHWYPHCHDDQSFVRALLNECKATMLAMQAVRKVNPKAQLIQTDDLGKIFSTPALAYQADFENERRWLAWDLLCGKVSRDHLLFKYLLRFGATEAELDWFGASACPPDVIGINHYLSSNRYLDEDLTRYPASSYGGNDKQRYADVLAARVLPEDAAPPRSLLREAWDRYQIPLAITELHNGCTREEQLRWYRYVWDDAVTACHSGVDVKAVTAWALLGSFDWNSLLTREDNCYEAGIFDVRSKTPRPTAIAPLIKELASGNAPSHPVLAAPGWWERDDRFHYGHLAAGLANPCTSAPILITGATGTLGQAFARLCTVRGLPFRLLRRKEMDVADRDSVRSAIAHHRPWAVINTAGYVRVDEAEIEPDLCFRENATAVRVLSECCAESGVALMTFSSDLVFDGTKNTPYVESDPVSPLNEYGRSKVAAEEAAMQVLTSALIVRTSAFFGPWDQHNFITATLNVLSAGREFQAAHDVTVSPTYIPDLVHTSLDLLIDGECGIWHLANRGEISWVELARMAAGIAGLDPSLVIATPMRMLELAAPRPHYSVLGSERALLMPKLEDAVLRYYHDRNAAERTGIEATFA